MVVHTPAMGFVERAVRGIERCRVSLIWRVSPIGLNFGIGEPKAANSSSLHDA